MKKIIVLIFSVFLLSGCTANYDLVYENGIFYESLNIVSQKDSIIDGESLESLIDDYYKNIDLLVDYNIQPGDASEDEIYEKYEVYNKSIINDSNNYGLNYNYTYNKNNKYVNSAIRYTLFENINITENMIIVQNAKDIFSSYSNLKEVVISFKTDRNIESSNADSIEKGIHKWRFNKNNFSNKDIKITLGENDFIENIKSNIEKIDDKEFDVIINKVFLLIGISLLIIIIFVIFKFKSSNKK